MNEKQKEEHLSTADLAVATEKERNGSENKPLPNEPKETPVEARSEGATRVETAAKPMALLPDQQIEDFQSRWNTVQTGFVDEPRSAVENADALVAQIMKRLAEIFAEERAQLEEQWTRGADVSTEDLRITLQRYRSFFTRLLSL
jgi:hypothetical protein